MKLKYLYIFILLSVITFVSCNEGYKQYDGVYVSGTLTNNPMITLTVDNQFPKVVDLTVASTELVGSDITVEMKTDADLVAQYNKKFKTNYEALSSDSYVLSHPTVVIEKGNYATSIPVRLNVLSDKAMVAGHKYMIPVNIAKVSDGYPVVEASRCVYVVLNQVVIGAALDMGSSGSLQVDFERKSLNPDLKYDPLNLPQFSFEMRVFMHKLPNGWFASIFGLEENIVLRSTTFNGGSGALELTGSGMTNITSPQPFPTQSWTHVAVTYDASTTIASLYLNGILVGSLPVERNDKFTGKNISLHRSYNGTSWNDHGQFLIGESVGGRYLNGVISEARIWAKTLTSAEVKNNMCAVDPSSEGLLAYWKFNENAAVQKFEDLTGNGFYAESRTLGVARWIEGVRCPEN